MQFFFIIISFVETFSAGTKQHNNLRDLLLSYIDIFSPNINEEFT